MKTKFSCDPKIKLILKTELDTNLDLHTLLVLAAVKCSIRKEDKEHREIHRLTSQCRSTFEPEIGKKKKKKKEQEGNAKMSHKKL